MFGPEEGGVFLALLDMYRKEVKGGRGDWRRVSEIDFDMSALGMRGGYGLLWGRERRIRISYYSPWEGMC